MLRNLVQFLKDVNPEVFIGWNVNFDFTYLYTRMKNLGMSADLISPLGYVTKRRGQLDVKGIFSYDLLQAYRKFKGYTFRPPLDYAAREEGFPQKMELDWYSSWKDGQPDPNVVESILKGEIDGKCDINHLLAYNRRDTELLLLIDRKYRLTESNLMWHYLPISRGVPLTETFQADPLADYILLKRAKKEGFALPTRTGKHREKMLGAVVYQPPTGVHESIAVFDFKGMYPSIVILFNIGPDTKVPVEKECDLCDRGCKNEVKQRVSELQEPLSYKEFYNNQTLPVRCPEFYHPDVVMLPNGVKFWRTHIRKTILATLIEELFRIRQRYKDEMKKILERERKENQEYKILDTKQTHLKFFTNAFSYGVVAYRRFRLQDVEVAASIPWLGRYFNIKTREALERRCRENGRGPSMEIPIRSS
jgi:DNA polymerase elongation subunit (family B)